MSQSVNKYWGFYCGLIVFAIFNCASVIGQNQCASNENCVPVHECSYIINALTSAPTPLPQNLLEALRKTQCGYDVSNKQYLVCCRAAHRNLKLLPDFKNCGPLMAERIAFGEKTMVFEYPWMALLRYTNTRTGKLTYQCGGSLINARYILTAAHCVTRLPGDQKLISVVLGEHTIGNATDCNYFSGLAPPDCAPPVQEIEVERVDFPPNYNRPRFANDIALIRLKSEPNMSLFHIRPVCLPITEEIQNMNFPSLIVAGWGTTETTKASTELLQAKIRTVSYDKCQEKYRGSITLTSNQFCGSGENGMDTCKGDSGGPLFAVYAEKKMNNFVQYGVVSAGPPDCGVKEDGLGIYTSVGHHMQWILDTIY